jgi:predicted dehydrogenase
MRIAVLGLGFMGSTHLRALREVAGAELAAVYSGDERKLAGDLSAVQGNIGGPGEKLDFSAVRKFREIEPLLADSSIDAVDICLPTDLHEWAAVEAMRNGKHVLVEKPMAIDGFGADRMLGASRKYNRVLMTAHVLRFFPEYTALADTISGGKLGRMRFAMFRRRCAAPAWGGWLQDPERSGGGILDLLIHDADMCLHLFGKPKTVAASGSVDPHTGLDCINAQLYYADGGLALVSGGWYAPGEYPFSMEYSVALEGGSVEYSSIGRPPAAYPRNGAAQTLELDKRDGYTAELDYFVKCCRARSVPERCPPAESALAVKLIMLLLDSRKRNGAKLLCNL